MSVIVVIIDSNKDVYIGSDTQYTTKKYGFWNSKNEKYFTLFKGQENEMTIGMTGLPILRDYVNSVLSEKRPTNLALVLNCFIEAISGRAHANNLLTDHDRLDWDALVVFKKEIIKIDCKFGCQELDTDHAAIGSGADAALGVVKAYKAVDIIEAEDLINVAINIASEVRSNVGGTPIVTKL